MEATRALSSVLSKEDDKDGSLEVVLDEIRARIEKREVKSTVIGLDTIESIVVDLSSSEKDLASEKLQLLDAFSAPRISFDERSRSYSIDPKPVIDLHASVESRARMFRERLVLTQLRLLRSGQFVLKGMKSGGKSGGAVGGGPGASSSQGPSSVVHEISTIESLLGSKGIKVLLGLLTQPEEGKFFLEDLTTTISLDLSQSVSPAAIFTEGSIVIVEGRLHPSDQSVFCVTLVMMPPAETRETALNSMAITDPFGNNNRPNQLLQMEEIEKKSVEFIIVIVSDIVLDRPGATEQLHRIFEGFESAETAPLFVLLGPFLSKPIAAFPGGRVAALHAFEALSDSLEGCEFLCREAKFLLIPGPRDAGCSSALPRRALPDELVTSLKKKVSHLTLASNPCRIRYYTQEIVFFREGLISQMQRNALPAIATRMGENDPELYEQFIETILDQGY